MKRFQMLIPILLTLLLSACAKTGDDDGNKAFKGMSAKQLFTESQTSMKKKQYVSAIKQLEALESMYPFSDYTEQAQIDLIAAYYENNEYPSSAASAERFVHLYPRSSKVDYAYYMKALANFQQVRGLLADKLPMDESWRDPGTQIQAYQDFSALVQQFPDSKYAANAKQRMIYLRNMFAQKEYNIANYYFERKMYIAANERANYVVKNYPQAPAAKKALELLYKSNQALGLKRAAEEVLAVYKASYNSSLVG